MLLILSLILKDYLMVNVRSLVFAEVVDLKDGDIRLKEIFAFKQKGLTDSGEVDGSFILYKYVPKVYKKIKSKGIDSIDDIFLEFMK